MNKKLLIIVPIIVIGVVALGVALGFEGGLLNGAEAQFITAPENNAYYIGQKNFQSEYKDNITDENSLQYKLDDKYIGFKPVSMRWDTTEFKTVKESSLSLAGDTFKQAEYLEVFDIGIDLYVEENERTWSKIVKIESLKDLGRIPRNTEHLEIEYAMDTNFIIDGWNTASTTLELSTTTPTRLGDHSYLQVASAWDSYSEEVCEGEICEILTNKTKLETYIEEIDGQKYYVKKIPVSWLKTAQYPIYTDADISYGTTKEFESGVTKLIRTTEIDTNKFATCYQDYGDADAGKCIVGSVNGFTITFGAISEFAADIVVGGSEKLDVAKLDTDKLVVVFVNDDSGDDGFARAVTVSGTTIGTWGTPKEIETGDTEAISCAPLDTNKFVACYNDETAGNIGNCVAGSVSGTTISNGTPVQFTTAQPSTNGTTQLGTDKFVNCYAGTDSDGYCVAGTVSTLAITMGSEQEFKDATTAFVEELVSPGISDDQFILGYTDKVGKTGNILVSTVTAGTTTITFGTESEFSSQLPLTSAIANIDATHFVIAYAPITGGGAGKSKYSNVDWGTRTSTFGSEEEFESGATSGGQSDSGLDTALISTNKIVICYQDDTDSDKGECIVGILPLDPIISDTWWDTDFQDRVRIDFDTTSSATTTNLYDFPASVKLNSTRIDYSKIDEDYGDLRFLDQDNATELYFEMEKYDETATSTIWVKVPNLKSNSSTDHIWMYYNNTGAATSSYATTSGVWDDNFVMVHHLQETDIDGGAGDIKDSTENHVDGTTTGMGVADQVAGRLDGAMDFDGDDDNVQTDDDKLKVLTEGTIEVWFEPDIDTTILTMVSLGTLSYGTNLAELNYRGGIANDPFEWIIKEDNIETMRGRAASIYPTANTFYHAAITVDASGNFFYHNGSQTDLVYTTGNAATPNFFDDVDAGSVRTDAFRIGMEANTAETEFDGAIDEVRISNINRGDNWIEFSYCNYIDTCITFNAAESQAAAATRRTYFIN